MDGHSQKLELIEVAAEITQAEELLAAQGIRRDALIRSLSEAGVSRREVAALAKVSPGRIQQLLSGTLFKVQLSEGAPVYSDGTTGPRGRHLNWEGEARSKNAAITAAQRHWREQYSEAFPGGAVSAERAGTP